MHRFSLRLTLALGGALLLLGAFVGQSIAADRTVRIVSSDYTPDPARITVGDRVIWVNDDSLPHDASGNGWSTPMLLNGERASIRFIKAGTYRYTCTIHPEMSGRVIVQAAGGQTAPPTDPDAGSLLTGAGTTAPLVLLVAVGLLGFGLALRRIAVR